MTRTSFNEFKQSYIHGIYKLHAIDIIAFTSRPSDVCVHSKMRDLFAIKQQIVQECEKFLALIGYDEEENNSFGK